MTPAWFPDWRGQTAVVVASGPSAKDVDLDEARGRARVMVINTSWRLAPWADVLYASDTEWWKVNAGLPQFPGLKITQSEEAAQRYGIHRVTCVKKSVDLVLEPKGRVGWGGNGGFHAVNLAVQFGARKLILVGFDMRLDLGSHWHGKHPNSWRLNNPKPHFVAKWRAALDGIAPQLAAAGVTVTNCSPVSALTAYRKMSFQDALDA